MRPNKQMAAVRLFFIDYSVSNLRVMTAANWVIHITGKTVRSQFSFAFFIG